MRIRTAGNSATLSYRYVISLCEGEEGGSVVEPFYKKKYIGRKVGGGGENGVPAVGADGEGGGGGGSVWGPF